MNVDFQGAGEVTSVSTGGVLQPSGLLWNVNGPGYGAEASLVTSHGVASGIILWTDGFTGTRVEGDALYGDYFVGDIELRGLVANEAYELVLYNAANILSSYHFGGSWTLTGASATPPGVCAYHDPSLATGVEGCDFLRGIAVADENGVIAIGAGFGAIAGLQLDLPGVPNPEPSILLLQGLAVVMGLMRRRRE
ncbi:MAG: hypothetical protein O3A87_08120 [Verrucomicrobia bacterium]|nr:hypothetical protein [Verrucomicrobiota bacterium]MDA1006433.1 hypothetical protein [Verrucomicrobiota bacterium]